MCGKKRKSKMISEWKMFSHFYIYRYIITTSMTTGDSLALLLFSICSICTQKSSNQWHLQPLQIMFLSLQIVKPKIGTVLKVEQKKIHRKFMKRIRFFWVLRTHCERWRTHCERWRTANGKCVMNYGLVHGWFYRSEKIHFPPNKIKIRPKKLLQLI